MDDDVGFPLGGGGLMIILLAVCFGMLAGAMSQPNVIVDGRVTERSAVEGEYWLIVTELDGGKEYNITSLDWYYHYEVGQYFREGMMDSGASFREVGEPPEENRTLEGDPMRVFIYSVVGFCIGMSVICIIVANKVHNGTLTYMGSKSFNKRALKRLAKSWGLAVEIDWSRRRAEFAKVVGKERIEFAAALDYSLGIFNSQVTLYNDKYWKFASQLAHDFKVKEIQRAQHQEASEWNSSNRIS